MKSKFCWFVICGALALQSPAVAEDSEQSAEPGQQPAGITLHLAPQRPAFMAATFGNDLDKMRATDTYKTATRYGIDPFQDLFGYVAVRKRRAGWFYLFHNTVSSDPPCDYFVQRIHKRVSDYASRDGEPKVSDLYLVEAFKNQGGQLKRPDQHYGSFSLRNFERRLIEKTIEIGEPARDDDQQESAPWPYDSGKLAFTIQPYDASRDRYDAVRFRRSVAWTLRVELDATGQFRLQASELGIDIDRQAPLLPPAALVIDEYPQHIQLTPGVGIQRLPIGITEDDAIRLAGAPIRIIVSGSSRILRYDSGLSLVFGVAKRLIAIEARAPFPGKTSAGIRLGSDRQAVAKAHGTPLEQGDAFDQYNGLRVAYDGNGKVRSLNIFRKQQRQEPDPRPAD